MRTFLILMAVWPLTLPAAMGSNALWRIGQADGSDAEFALAGSHYTNFLQFFGDPRRVYYIGLSQASNDWPYVLPGPLDAWAGSHYRPRNHNEWDQMNTLPVGFVLDRKSTNGLCVLAIRFCDTAPDAPPRLRMTVNGAIFETQLASGGSDDSLAGDLSQAKPQTIRAEFPAALLRTGYNEIALRSTAGSWSIFDSLELEVPEGFRLGPPSPTIIRSVSAAPYAVSTNAQMPATLRVEVFRQNSPDVLNVQIGDAAPVDVALASGLQAREIPARAGRARVRLRSEGELLADTDVELASSPPVTPADYVNLFMGTAHSRWMLAPGPWMPFSMVKISPDNQAQSWCAGYDYSHEYIDCFSHLHEWTTAGLGMMPAVGPLRTHPGLDTGYSSRFDKSSERGGIGFYEVFLKDSGIKVELTATTRATLQRYTYPASDEARVLIPFLLPNEYEMHVVGATVRRTSSNELEGVVRTFLPHIYGCDQQFDLHFVTQFSRPFGEFGGWQNLPGSNVTIPGGSTYPEGETNGEIFSNVQELNLSGDCGAMVKFKTTAGEAIELRTGISFVSAANARLNLDEELTKPFGWDFRAVVENQRRVWNDLFDRIEIQTPNALEKSRFYSNLYRALSGRNIWSDLNGQWRGPDGTAHEVADKDTVMLSSDALWTTFWNLNQLMNLAAPEWSARWTKSELEMYDNYGWLAKGPAGLKYISVMVAEHEIPLMVAAYQSGLTNLDAEKILAAAVKMQTTPPQATPGGGRAGNENLAGYLKYGYVPASGPLKGRTSNTYEYAYDDWTVGQLALALGRNDLAQAFSKRSRNWRNSFDSETGFARPRQADGQWVTPFDPIRTFGFVEANAWQYTWFVPQDVPGLINSMGRERFIDRLTEAFEVMRRTRFAAVDGRDRAYPINQGNETCMHVSWLFNWAGQPWRTQRWTRAILDSYYGYDAANAYLGDDDQGQMSSWFVMSALGLFQTDGGCRVDPIYELGSPLYAKARVHVRNNLFTIETRNASVANCYIQSATFNGQPLNQWWIREKDVINGGQLVIDLGPKPNTNWANNCPLPPTSL